jgi:hypothetical protein
VTKEKILKTLMAIQEQKSRATIFLAHQKFNGTVVEASNEGVIISPAVWSGDGTGWMSLGVVNIDLAAIEAVGEGANV